MISHSYCVVASLMALGIPAAAQTPPAPSSGNTSSTDLAVPDSPAFTVLGISPQNVTRPTSPKDLAASLLNGLDQNGNFQTGIALDTAPFLLIAGSKLTIADYAQHYVTRLFSRIETSLGTTRGTSEAESLPGWLLVSAHAIRSRRSTRR